MSELINTNPLLSISRADDKYIEEFKRATESQKMESLEEVLKNKDPYIRIGALGPCKYLSSEDDVMKILKQSAKDENDLIRSTTFSSVLDLLKKPDNQKEFLRMGLDDKSPEIRSEVIDIIESYILDFSVRRELLTKASTDKDVSNSDYAKFLLERLDEELFNYGLDD